MTVSICEDCGHGRRVGCQVPEQILRAQLDVSDVQARPALPHEKRWPHRDALVAAEISRLEQPGRVLDIGCGNGRALAALGRGWQRYGIEISPRAAAFARSFAGAQVHCGPVESYESDPGFFDVITAFALIEHVQEPRRLVQRIWS